MNTTKFTTIVKMVVSCIICSCSNTVATERITFYSAIDQVKLSLETPQSALDVTSSLKPKIPIKYIQPKSITNLIPVSVFGGIVIIGIIIVAVISNNKDKDNTVSGANDNNTNTEDGGKIPKPSPLTNAIKVIHLDAIDPILEEQKAKLVIRVLATALKYCENWPGTQKEKEEFTKELVLIAFYLESNLQNLQNTYLVGSTIMARALDYCLIRFPHGFWINALNLDPKGTWDRGYVARNLFDQKDMDEDFITNVVLKEYTDEQIEEDCNTIITTAHDIKNNADKYAEVILEPHKSKLYSYTTIYNTDPGIISFLPPDEDSLESYLITPEGLTNYLKWCADQLIKNALKAIKYSGTSLQKSINFSIHVYAKLIDFWNNGPLTLEQKEELTKKIALAIFDESRSGIKLSIARDFLIDFIVEKYNAKFDEEATAPRLEHEIIIDRVKLIDTINYIIENADSLSAKILSYFSEPVTTTNQELIDSFPECELKDNPNLVTVEILAGYLRGYAEDIYFLFSI